LAFLQENLFKPAKAICNFFGKRNETNWSSLSDSGDFSL
jgi:hypothetical protein